MGRLRHRRCRHRIYLGAFIETLYLTGLSDLSGTGNELVNEIYGNEGANSLNGMAGR